jgi:hypothetical protein
MEQKENAMTSHYHLVNVRMFLEPADHILFNWIGSLNEASRVQLPEKFLLEAEKEMGLVTGAYGEIHHFLKDKAGPSAYSFLPTIQPIQKFKEPDEREAFFAMQAQSPWDAAFSRFDTEHAHNYCINLLVEYELYSFYELSENDCQYLYLDCKQRYNHALTASKAAYGEGHEAEAVRQAWQQAAAAMVKTYGIPAERMEGIMKNADPNWKALGSMPEMYPSFVHTPKVHYVISPPWKPKYFYQVIKH